MVSKEYVAVHNFSVVAGPRGGLDALRGDLIESSLSDEELAEVVVCELVPAFTVRAMAVRLLPIKPAKPQKKGR